MSTIDELFHYMTINRIVSRLQGPNHRLCQYYGLMPGGANTDDIGGEKFGWDLYDRTRQVATGRARGTGPAARAPNKIGSVNATVYRSFEQVPVDYDRIYRNRGLGESLGTFDVMGEKYLTKQIGTVSERFMNNRELLTALAFRGGFELEIKGDDMYPVPIGTGGPITVDVQHPATNQGNVEGVFAGNWDDPAAGKVVKELLALNDHSANNSRYPQQVAWVRAETAYNILQNEEVQKMGGTANMVFQDGSNQLGFEPSNNDEGQLSNVMAFVLRGFPAMKWFIYDDHVTLHDGTSEPFLDVGEALFTPERNSSWLEWKNGSEPVQKSVAGKIEDQFGFAMWQETQRNPVGVSLYALDNGLPAPYVPSAWYRATVHS